MSALPTVRPVPAWAQQLSPGQPISSREPERSRAALRQLQGLRMGSDGCDLQPGVH